MLASVSPLACSSSMRSEIESPVTTAIFALKPFSLNARATASRAPCGLSPPAFITNFTPRGAASGHSSVSIGTQSRA